MKFSALAFAAAAAIVSVAPAQALTYAFSFTGSSDSGSGFLTTAGAPVSPITGITGQVPEPASWAMMIVGFGMVGFAARRRTAALAA